MSAGQRVAIKQLFLTGQLSDNKTEKSLHEKNYMVILTVETQYR